MAFEVERGKGEVGMGLTNFHVLFFGGFFGGGIFDFFGFFFGGGGGLSLSKRLDIWQMMRRE